MRPHHLRLTAFGPFAGTVEVDLDALAAGGLFLLHGPTGAGKTTLLDAMCFALFGSVPGTRGVKRLRSDHAAPGVRCEVALELTVAGRRLRVTRSPAYVRAKRRGEGTTEEKGSLRIEEQLGSRWTTWSTRPDEAGEMIAALVGMSAEQFTQVVLLPQGAFATFLHAGAADRGALLQQLFATDRFGAVENWLADAAGASRQQLADTSARLATLVARVAQEAGTTAPEEIDVGWYDETLAALADALLLARTEAVAADAAVEAAASVHRSQQDLAAGQARHAAAVTTLAALEQGAPEAAAGRARLQAASVAGPLLPLVERAEQTRAAADAAGEAGDPADLRARADTARLQLGRLEALAPLAARVEAAVAEQASTLAQLAALGRRRSEVASERAALPPLVAAAVATRDDAAAAYQELPAAEAAAATLQALVADGAARQQLERRLATARDAETAARERAVTAAEARVAVQTALVAGQAARLARLLVDGEPCAVCGALEHPAPTGRDERVPAQVVPDEAEVEAAELDAEVAQQAREAAGAAVAALSAAMQTHTDRLVAAGWADLSALAAAADAAGGRVEQLAARAARLAAAAATASALAERSAELDVEAAGLDREQAAMGASAARQEAAAADDRAALVAALGDASDLATALAATAAEVAELDAATSAAVEAAGLRAEAETAAGGLTRALTGTGFAGAAAVRAAALPASTVRALTDELAAYEAELAAARRSPDLSTPAEPVADPAASGTVLAEREAEQAQRREVASVRADRHAQVERLGPELRAAVSDLAPLVAAHAEITALAELVRGGNPLGMRLSTYVLAARLEQVAAAASARLLQMTDGRYALRHTDVRLDRRSKGGLGLVVIDGWTGTERDTGTLSGGETFSASLALALGLADVVTAEAGGAPIEALFVDEGFGSLDEDTLEEVMDVLDGLRSGGRVVGVVSHVAELRRRIPVQLRVHKGRDGSTLELAG